MVFWALQRLAFNACPSRCAAGPELEDARRKPAGRPKEEQLEEIRKQVAQIVRAQTMWRAPLAGETVAPDGRTLATPHNDGTVTLKDRRANRSRGVLQGPKGQVVT